MTRLQILAFIALVIVVIVVAIFSMIAGGNLS
jgi:hypothetical protein